MAIASLLVVPALVHAESSVTLYGLIDNGIQYINGMPGGHSISMESGNWTLSKFGLKGAEDLGGGTKAVFLLESAFSTANGALWTENGIFANHAYVGLENGQFGTFHIGRMGNYELAQDSYSVDPQFMQYWGIQTAVRGRNWSQTSNAVEYESPKWGGFSVKGQYALSNGTNWNAAGQGEGSGPGQMGGAQGRSDGLALTYEAGPVNLMAIYDEIRDANGQFDNAYTASRSILAGATYQLGPVKLFGGYQHLSAPDASAQGYANEVPPSGATLPTAVDQEWLGANWQATRSALLMAAVYHTNTNHGNGNATLLTLGGKYSLSKRTFFYGEAGAMLNSRRSNVGLNNGYTDWYGANANQGGDTTSPSYGGSQVGAFAGIVTEF